MDSFYQTTNGYNSACLYSGEVAPTLTGARGAVAVGSDVMFASGAGRLNCIIPHQAVMILSGVAGQFYDAAAPVSGGPIPASGHIPLVNSLFAAGSLQGSGTQVAAGVPINVNLPFNSGLCYNSRSGQTGFTVVWTREDLQGRG